MGNKVDWYYHRKGCKTCTRSDVYLESRNVEVQEKVDCKKHPLDRSQAEILLDGIEEVLAVQNKAVKHYDRQSQRSDVLSSIIGPTGNLRAPSLRLGNRLIVGFDESLYASQFA